MCPLGGACKTKHILILYLFIYDIIIKNINIKSSKRKEVKMNIFNRVVMIILLLFLIVSSIVIALNIFTDLFRWSDIFDRILNAIERTNPYIVLLIFIAIIIIGIVILVFEFYRRKIKVANIASDQAGKTMVTLRTVSSQIRENLADMDGVVDPRIRIIPKHDGIIINTFSKLAKGISVTEKTREIREAVSDFASKKLGFKVIKSNYTATGFVTTKVKKVKEEFIKKEPEISVEKKEANNIIEETKTPTPEDESK